MGDRVSIEFYNSDEDESSVVLFSHWGGMGFVNRAEHYAEALIAERGDSMTLPIDRLEASTVMVDFIRYVTDGQERVTSDLYLGASEHDGDNSDNGHHVIELKKRGRG